MTVNAYVRSIPFLPKIAAYARSKKIVACLVGGVLRDFYFGRRDMVRDVDIAVQKNAIGMARHCARISGGTLVVLDEDTRSYRVVIQHKSMTLHYDFTDWRAPVLEEDLRQRDFTVNALAFPLARYPDGECLDVCGGLKDIRARILRSPSSGVFRDDPLRILRAFSVGAMCACRIDPCTWKSMLAAKHLLKKVSAERVAEELFKLFRQEQSIGYVRKMSEGKILDEVIPEIRRSRGCVQGDYHHLDVWDHTLLTLQKYEEMTSRKNFSRVLREYLSGEVVSGRSRNALIKVACLLHDIGKPKAKRRKQGKTIFYEHERYGRLMTDVICKRLKLSTKERQFLMTLVFWHLRPGCLVQDRYPTDRAIYRFFRDTGQEGVSIILLSIADWRATRGKLVDFKKKPSHERILFKLVDDYFILKEKKEAPPLVNGYDIMKRFRLEPSKLVGIVLAKVREEQLLGKIRTKSGAYREAQQVIDNNRVKLV